MTDPASRVIGWFGWLMLAVFSASAFIAGWTLWRLWLLASALLVG